MTSVLRVQVSPSALLKRAQAFGWALFFGRSVLGQMPLETTSSDGVASAPTLSIVFVSNGPGELSTWVRPLAEQLHRSLQLRPRAAQSLVSLQLVLVPCPNATGHEAEAAGRWGCLTASPPPDGSGLCC